MNLKTAQYEEPDEQHKKKKKEKKRTYLMKTKYDEPT